MATQLEIYLGVTVGQAGVSGTAASFDGNGWVNVSSNKLSGLGDQVARTVEAWCYPTSWPSGNGDFNLGIVSKHEASLGFAMFLRRNVDGTHRFFGEFGSPGSPVLPVTGLDYPTTFDEWHHVVLTFSRVEEDGATNTVLQLYVDGDRRMVQNAMPPQIHDGPFPLFIGASEQPQKFIGSIDEVALYSTALSDARIQAHYSAGMRSIRAQ